MLNVTGSHSRDKKTTSIYQRVKANTNPNCFGFAGTHVLYCSLSRETVARMIVKHIEKTYIQIVNPQDKHAKPLNYLYFRCLTKPVITLERYVHELVVKGLCSQEAMIMAVFLLGKLDAKQINELTIHRLLLLSLVISSKFWDDFYVSNKKFASNGGVSLYELNKLEWSMMEMLGFDVWVSQTDFESTFTLIVT